jgi:hypothetical protein
VRALEAASDEKVLAMRGLVRDIRTGRLEHTLRNAANGRELAEREAFVLCADWARMQRYLLRGNSLMTGYIFSVYLAGDGPPIPLPQRYPVDVDEVLRAWRESG